MEAADEGFRFTVDYWWKMKVLYILIVFLIRFMDYGQTLENASNSFEFDEKD